MMARILLCNKIPGKFVGLEGRREICFSNLGRHSNLAEACVKHRQGRVRSCCWPADHMTSAAHEYRIHMEVHWTCFSRLCIYLFVHLSMYLSICNSCMYVCTCICTSMYIFIFVFIPPKHELKWPGKLFKPLTSCLARCWTSFATDRNHRS